MTFELSIFGAILSAALQSVFLLALPELSNAQNCLIVDSVENYTYDTASVFLVEPSNLDLGGQLWVFDSSENDSVVRFAAAHHAHHNRVLIGEYNFSQGLIWLSFKYPGRLKLDRRLMVLGLATNSEKLCINLGGHLLIFERSGKFIRHLEIGRWWQGVFLLENDNILLVDCYDHAPGWAPADWSMKIIDQEGRAIAERTGNACEMFLTNFGPTSLFDVNKKHVIRAAPGQSTVYWYDLNLILKDSLVIREDWRSGDEWKAERLWDTTRKPIDGVSLAMDAMDEAVLKVHRVCFANDTTVMLTCAVGKDSQIEYVCGFQDGFTGQVSVSRYERSDRMKLAEQYPDQPMEGSWFGYHNLSAYSAIVGGQFYLMYPWTDKLPVGMTLNEFMEYRRTGKLSDKLAIQVWRYDFTPGK
ncbi:MAG: hypothetical protein ACK500_07635 [Flavobacteriales bacterium]